MESASKLKLLFENARAIDCSILDSNMIFLQDMLPLLTTKFYYISDPSFSRLIIPNSVYFNEFGQIIRLNLAENKLTRLPHSFAFLSALETLDISFNLLTELPSFFTRFSHLKSINLDHNQFTAFPKELELLASLECVSFMHNHLSRLPLALCSVSYPIQLTENIFLTSSDQSSTKNPTLGLNPLGLDFDSFEIWSQALKLCLQECRCENPLVKFARFQEFLVILLRQHVFTKYAEKGLEIPSDNYILLL